MTLICVFAKNTSSYYANDVVNFSLTRISDLGNYVCQTHVHCMIKRFLPLLFLYSFSLPSFGTVIPKIYKATFTATPVKIDGLITDTAWNKAIVAGDFVQLDPTEGAPVTQQTEVRLLYDNSAVYVSAMLYDTHPDSILYELGNRDEGDNLNSDGFRFGFDPYNKRQNGYVFQVSASGVQTEYYDDDYTFDAVWQSAVAKLPNGWSVEMRIPYSAFRFPAGDEQVWGVQFARLIRRNREYDQWTLTPKNVQNRMNFWGTMEGIKNVDPPLRLSLTPYISIYTEQAPRYLNGEISGHENSYSYSGGADLKYGIDERFSLDMTLLPDFSQVKSDNKVKNLSAFETFYSENRPFFKEGVSIFSKGNAFYSRRIASTPEKFYDVPNELAPDETIEKNPDKARLLNATKVSGRTDKGLGIGLLNAITGNTYAVIRKTDGGQRKILTSPLTNFNVLALDQQFKHNCNFYLTNTNVLRDGSSRDANVLASGGRFENKNHEYSVAGGFTLNHIVENLPDKKITNGHIYYVAADKISGASWYGASFETADKNFDKNDLGYSSYRDYTSLNAYYTYNFFNPFWKYFKTGNVTAYLGRSGRLSDHNRLASINAGINFFLLLHSNWSIFFDIGNNFLEGADYYEPRTENRFNVTPKSLYTSLSMTTNYNKALAFDFGGSYTRKKAWESTYGYVYIAPIVRASDRLSFRLDYSYSVDHNDRGHITDDYATQSIIYGNRSITTVENALTSRYLFKNDMSLSLTGRHYWSKGNYDGAFVLGSDGEFSPSTYSSYEEYNFNSNYFTIDLVYNWQFAPGSSFIITYKNQIFADDSNVSMHYLDNFNSLFDQPQTNSVSLKVLYYLDYKSRK